jgi:hypothetical protein
MGEGDATVCSKQNQLELRRDAMLAFQVVEVERFITPNAVYFCSILAILTKAEEANVYPSFQDDIFMFSRFYGKNHGINSTSFD